MNNRAFQQKLKFDFYNNYIFQMEHENVTDKFNEFYEYHKDDFKLDELLFFILLDNWCKSNNIKSKIRIKSLLNIFETIDSLSILISMKFLLKYQGLDYVKDLLLGKDVVEK